MEEVTLATELLHELKQSNKRWFYAFIIILCLWFATIAGFLWYASLPVEEETTEVTQDNSGDGNTMIGVGDYGAADSKNNQTP